VKILEARENEGNFNLNLVKAHVLEALGNNLRLKANINLEKQPHYREKAEQCLHESLALNTSFPNNDFKLASNHQNLGHIYFDQKEFSKAKKSYEKYQIA
jgi:tetratricopeptide (TPR) repeat protein